MFVNIVPQHHLSISVEVKSGQYTRVILCTNHLNFRSTDLSPQQMDIRGVLDTHSISGQATVCELAFVDILYCGKGY